MDTWNKSDWFGKPSGPIWSVSLWRYCHKLFSSILIQGHRGMMFLNDVVSQLTYQLLSLLLLLLPPPFVSDFSSLSLPSSASINHPFILPQSSHPDFIPSSSIRCVPLARLILGSIWEPCDQLSPDESPPGCPSPRSPPPPHQISSFSSISVSP